MELLGVPFYFVSAFTEDVIDDIKYGSRRRSFLVHDIWGAVCTLTKDWSQISSGSQWLIKQENSGFTSVQFNCGVLMVKGQVKFNYVFQKLTVEQSCAMFNYVTK